MLLGDLGHRRNRPQLWRSAGIGMGISPIASTAAAAAPATHPTAAMLTRRILPRVMPCSPCSVPTLHPVGRPMSSAVGGPAERPEDVVHQFPGRQLAYLHGGVAVAGHAGSLGFDRAQLRHSPSGQAIEVRSNPRSVAGRTCRAAG